MALVKEICPICLGAKVIFIPDNEQADNGKDITCRCCNGEGYVMVEEADDEEGTD